MHEFGESCARDMSRGNSDASFAEPHEYRHVEHTLAKLLDLMRRGLLPANLMPALSNLHSEVIDTPCFRCHLLALSHDEMGVIFDGLAESLQPVVAVALSSTCKGLRTPLGAALEVLQQRHVRAAALCVKMKTTCAELRYMAELEMSNNMHHLDAEDMATLGMILRTNTLPNLENLQFSCAYIGDAGMQAICESFNRVTTVSLTNCDFMANNIGPAGADALAAALGRGGLPKLEHLDLTDNPIGSHGMAVLAAPLRKVPALCRLVFNECELGDEGVASLVANLGKDDFKSLQDLEVLNNQVTDQGCAILTNALAAGAMPRLRYMDLAGGSGAGENAVSEAAVEALNEVLRCRRDRRGR